MFRAYSAGNNKENIIFGSREKSKNLDGSLGRAAHFTTSVNKKLLNFSQK